ncbi:aromatic acid exporter family protein [Radiobacillus sp. PE A8.2]|uniref:aromatic acid exporter family protein n=1 Tax=Radiobacillus sp. PE A8.2 TaxID=3380349 RepID=UPI00388F73FF
MKKLRFFGSRVVKTGVAVFLTSLLCQWLGWPAVFAVITAIVTIEPTVSDSIKKGIVRLPASAIGSAYAVMFIFLFGNSPITYTAAALFTIITCFRLNLHAGLLVATLTSVAMIEVIHDNFFIAFLIRLGTTSIGLLISTVVNMFVLPPNYTKNITSNINSLLSTYGVELDNIIKVIIGGVTQQSKEKYVKETFSQLKVKLDKTEMLLQFQKDEAKYHRLDEQGKKIFQQEQEKLSSLRLIYYHFGNLINTELEKVSWDNQECQSIITAVETLAHAMKNPEQFDPAIHRLQVHDLLQRFWTSKQRTINEENNEKAAFFSSEIIILYELLSIYNLVELLLTDQDITT